MSDSDDMELLESGSNDYGSTGNFSSSSFEDMETSSERSAGFTSTMQPLLTDSMKPSGIDVEVPITLAWNNINVFAKAKQGKSCLRGDKSQAPPPKQILKNVSGIVSPGSLLAILGASGSGKTTLLNVLTSRNNSRLVVDGDVKVNGRSLGLGIANLSAYVQQDDLFIGTMTVKEHLVFHAYLRLGEKISTKEKESKVESVISEFGLKKCEDTMIGIPGMIKGLSGGERKRLSFASEVLTNPSLMFCDEPTSGLDSYMAQSIIQCLKKMASKGRTILCTIHQPSSEVYSLMDEVLLIAEGRTAYMGTTESVLKFFKSIGYPSPDHYNPADFFIHTLAVVPGKEKECKATIAKVCDYYEDSPYHHKTMSLIGDFNVNTDQFVVEMDNLGKMYSEKPKENQNKLDYDEERYQTCCWTQFKALYKRAWLGNLRNPMVTRARIVQIIVISIIYCLFYVHQFDGVYTQASVQNLNGAMLVMQTQLTLGNIFAVANTFPAEFHLFHREHNNFMYRRSCYYLARILSDIPIFLVIPMILVGITYYLIGFFMSWRAFSHMLSIFILVSMNSIAFAHTLGCTTSDVTLVLTGASAGIGPILLFSGYFLNSHSIPVYLIPLKYFSWYYYSMELLVVNQWKDVTHIACEHETPEMNETLTRYQSNETWTGNQSNVTQTGYQSACYKDGNEVLKSYSFTADDDMYNFGMLVGLFFFYEVLGYFLLLLRSRRKR